MWYALAHPDLVDLLVAAGRDPMTDRAGRAEFEAVISPFALLSPSGWRHRARLGLGQPARTAATVMDLLR